MAAVKTAPKRKMEKAGNGEHDEADNVRTTIVLPTIIHSLGVTKAGKVRRSFSNYVTTLIERDAAEAVSETSNQKAAASV